MSARTIEADVCVVGGGPAGIAVAHELIGSSLQVIVLESGDASFDAELQDASHGQVRSDAFGPDALAFGRRRQMGGASNLWLYRTIPDDGRRYARSVPPEPIDFEGRPGGVSPWPFGMDELRPYFERAQRMWNAEAFDYDASTWRSEVASPLPTAGGHVRLRVAQHGSREVFGEEYRNDLLRADGMEILTRTTALSVSVDSGGRVTGVVAADAGGVALEIRASTVVLAAGGLENAQLLLASRLGEAASGGRDLIGRFLTDHPEIRIGYLELERGIDPYAMTDFDVRWVNGTMVSAFLTLDEDLKRTEGLLNVSAALVGQPPGFGSEAHRAAHAILSTPSHRSLLRLAGSVAGAARRPRELATYARSRLRGTPFREFSGGWSQQPGLSRVFEVHIAAEQTPTADNRLSLGTATDRYGRRRLDLDWTWSAADRANVDRSVGLLEAELARAGIGQLRRWTVLGAGDPPRFSGVHHPMGSTRMDADPSRGVVDADCRVHGTDGLYVAGSSVFANGHGYANPTLTILALAIRLADHLRRTRTSGAATA
jgi:choline dehydrogenase-like flavoprotein